ncbi:MAG: hypothetical protein ACTSUE_17080 [Promethearchaeota archaeon]
MLPQDWFCTWNGVLVALVVFLYYVLVTYGVINTTVDGEQLYNPSISLIAEENNTLCWGFILILLVYGSSFIGMFTHWFLNYNIGHPLSKTTKSIGYAIVGLFSLHLIFLIASLLVPLSQSDGIPHGILLSIALVLVLAKEILAIFRRNVILESGQATYASWVDPDIMWWWNIIILSLAATVFVIWMYYSATFRGFDEEETSDEKFHEFYSKASVSEYLFFFLMLLLPAFQVLDYYHIDKSSSKSTV